MKRNPAIILATLLCIALVFTGCSAINGSSSPTTAAAPTTATVNLKADDLMADIKSAEWPATPVAPDAKTVAGISRFSASLLLESVKNEGNVMISPASIFLALAMTVNGADGKTKADMLKVMADQGVKLEMVNQASRNWISLLTQNSDKTILAIANSIWFDQNFQPDQPFLQRNADFFKAGARKLDFRDEASPDVINAWVKEATRGTIPKIVDKIPASTVMYLINSVYFKSDWLTPFEQALNRKQTFNTPDGAITAEFMNRTGKIGYFSGNGAAGVTLPYENGKFAFFALLPDGQTTPREWLAQQEATTLFTTITGMMAQKANFTVNLIMPKFEATFEDTLNNELVTLGMGDAFDGGLADFSLLNAAHSKGLYISEVKHKTFIRVDEKGTEAAAVTSVAIDESMPSYDKELILDRPFIYGIVDLATGLPLFTGILENPAE